MLYGYAREAAANEGIEEQTAALLAAGCAHVFTETDSRKRPQLALALQALTFGDMLLVTRLDRLARSAADLFDLYGKIAQHGAGVRSLTEPITDPATPEGRFFPAFVEWFAKFDATTLQDRLQDGRKRAMENGTRIGRRQKLAPEQTAAAVKSYLSGEATLEELGQRYGVHHTTILRAVSRFRRLTQS